jgi:hypothetical protein
MSCPGSTAKKRHSGNTYRGANMKAQQKIEVRSKPFEFTGKTGAYFKV